MKRHETPIDVAIRLAGFLPKRPKRVLDPAVGNGALLLPVLANKCLADAEFVLVDVDTEVISRLRSKREFPQGTRFVCRDFITWADRTNSEKFDVVIMNPPFAAGKADLVYVKGCGLTSPRHMPLEAAFIAKALDLLKDNGRLLSVLPSSIVMSSSLSWLRKSLFSSGAIVSVHELPPRCFPGVESRMYLLVFDRGKKQSNVELLNHDLNEPESMMIKVSDCVRLDRLDFGYHLAREFLFRLQGIEELGWKSLDGVIQVIRGSAQTPCQSKAVVHTSNFFEGIWQGSALKRKVNSSTRIRENDLLLKRIGRGASQTIGLATKCTGRLCTDCVFLIRPHQPSRYLQILFAMKIVLGFPGIRPLIEKGTGAAYIGSDGLLELKVPMHAYRIFAAEYAKFKRHVLRGNAQLVDQSVQVVQRKLLKTIARQN